MCRLHRNGVSTDDIVWCEMNCEFFEVVVIKTVVMEVVHCSGLLKPLHFIRWQYFHHQVTNNHCSAALGREAQKP